MTQSWVVSVRGQAYGPYTLEQMRGFIAEGRVVGGSLVSSPGEAVPYPVSADPVLAGLLPAPRPQAVAITETLVPAEPTALHKFGRNSDATEGETSHFIVLSDMKSGSISGLEEAIHNLGQAQPIMPQAWLLTSTFGLNAIRSALVQKLGTLDTLFVVDTTHDKGAWYNFGPEIDARIRRVWKKPTTPERKSA